MFYRIYIITLVVLTLLVGYLFIEKKDLEQVNLNNNFYISNLNKKLLNKDIEIANLKDELNLTKERLNSFRILIEDKEDLIKKLQKRRKVLFKNRVVYKYINCDKEKNATKYNINYFKDILINDGNYSF